MKRSIRLSVGLLALTALAGGCGGGGSSSSTGPGTLQVTSVAPDSGSVLGGSRASVKGSGFSAGVTAVFFGRVEATDVSTSGDTTINCTVPASRVSGYVDVRVEASTESATREDGFRYHDEPFVLGVTPPAGPAGLTVSILGYGFSRDGAGPPTVTFDEQISLLPQVVNDTLIFATAPAGPSGLVTVAVSNANGYGERQNAYLYLGSTANSFAALLVDGATPEGTALATVVDGEAGVATGYAFPDPVTREAAWGEIATGPATMR